MPLRQISPRIPTDLYLRVQRYRELRALSQRSLVELALQHALQHNIDVPDLPPESEDETTTLTARIDPDIFLATKRACAAADRRLRAFVAAALSSYLG